MRVTETLVKVLDGFVNNSKPMSGADFMNKYRIFSGSLYPLLRRLEGKGWVKSYWEEQDPHLLGRPRRRLYELTAKGRLESVEILHSPRGLTKVGLLGETASPIGRAQYRWESG